VRRREVEGVKKFKGSSGGMIFNGSTLEPI
jgi:hypothetical protein